MYEHAIDRLREAGWEHYEISNFARRSESRDNRCRHNLLYWSNYAYHGFGTGAAAYVGGTRTLNIRDLGAYIQRCREGRSAVTQSEMLEPEPRARETAMLQLRRLEGVHRDAFWTQTGYRLDALFGDSLPHFVEMGLLADDGNTVRLTRDGLPVADGILQAVL
jgi:oxygen-independent coproporphyrinogen-3 oxidase